MAQTHFHYHQQFERERKTLLWKLKLFHFDSQFSLKFKLWSLKIKSSLLSDRSIWAGFQLITSVTKRIAEFKGNWVIKHPFSFFTDFDFEIKHLTASWKRLGEIKVQNVKSTHLSSCDELMLNIYISQSQHEYQ